MICEDEDLGHRNHIPVSGRENARYSIKQARDDKTHNTNKCFFSGQTFFFIKGKNTEKNMNH